MPLTLSQYAVRGLQNAIEDRNKALNELKTQVFDKIDDEDEIDTCQREINRGNNTGFRTLKNIGVWLVLYALTKKEKKNDCLQALLAKANLAQNDHVNKLKSFLVNLIHENVLPKIIQDYCNAGGTFKIECHTAEIERQIKEKLKKYPSLENHVCFNPDSPLSNIVMCNEVSFQWTAQAASSSTPLTSSQACFSGIESLYLENKKSHPARYTQVDYMGKKYHVARLSIFTSARPAYVFIIEPFQSPDIATLDTLQKNYYAILCAATDQHAFNEKNENKKSKDAYFSEITKLASSSSFDSTKLPKRATGIGDKPLDFIVRFPKLALEQPLQTTEKNANIYQFFTDHPVVISEFLENGNLDCSETRSLTYDQTAQNSDETRTGLTYTVSGTYLLVYASANFADVVPFLIQKAVPAPVPAPNNASTSSPPTPSVSGTAAPAPKSAASTSNSTVFAKTPTTVQSTTPVTIAVENKPPVTTRPTTKTIQEIKEDIQTLEELFTRSPLLSRPDVLKLKSSEAIGPNFYSTIEITLRILG